MAHPGLASDAEGTWPQLLALAHIASGSSLGLSLEKSPRKERQLHIKLTGIFSKPSQKRMEENFGVEKKTIATGFLSPQETAMGQQQLRSNPIPVVQKEINDPSYRNKKTPSSIAFSRVVPTPPSACSELLRLGVSPG